MTPSDENKKRLRVVARTFTLPAQADSSALAQKQEKNQKNKRKMHCKIGGEIALNLFSIFTVYNTCNAIYIYIVNFCSCISAILQ